MCFQAVSFLRDLKSSSDSNELKVPGDAPVVPVRMSSISQPIIPPVSFKVTFHLT